MRQLQHYVSLILGGIGAIALLFEANNLRLKNDEAQLMAALYGLDSEKYLKAESEFWKRVSQDGLIILTLGGTAKILGPKIANSKTIQNIFDKNHITFDGLILNKKGNVVGNNHEANLYEYATNIFPKEAYIFLGYINQKHQKR